jgi:cytochrome c oxidase assembly protein subunit 11
MAINNNHSLKQKNRRLVWRLVIITLFMFGFGFALVPLYDVICKATGINGKMLLSPTEAASLQKEDVTREVTIEFTTTMNENLPWEFHPMHKQVSMHPGGVIHTAYFAKNLTNKTMTIQAIPSIAPGPAAKHIKKLECFCFTQQTLKGGESAEMPLKFILDPDLPRDIKTISISYTLFDLTEKGG